MGECLDQLHVQCVILGEILLGTLDRVREELINDGELRLYQGAAMETGRRQVVEYLITMYYRYKAQKLLVQKAPSDSVEIKVEANDGWQTHQGEEQEKVIEGTSILKPSPKKKPVRKRGRPSATVSKATISINNINNSYEVDNRDEPQTKTKRISEEFAVTSETVDTKWLNCYVNLEPSVASDNNKVNNEPKSESDDHITDAGDNMDDISSDEEGHPDDHIKDADYNPSGNTPVKVCSTLFSPQRSSTEVTHQPAVTQPRKTQHVRKEDDKANSEASEASSVVIEVVTPNQIKCMEDDPPTDPNCKTDPSDCQKEDGQTTDQHSLLNLSASNIQDDSSGDPLFQIHSPDGHIPENQYKCNICFKSYSSKCYVKIHHNLVHKPPTYNCSLCKLIFPEKRRLESHVQKEHMGVRFTCNLCTKSFKNKKTLKLHKDTHEGKYKFHCTICVKGFQNKSELAVHENRHNKIKPHMCKTCPKRFTSSSDKTRHERSCMMERPGAFSCPSCYKSFKSKEYLHEHKKLHDNSEEFKCKICHRCYSHRSSLFKHQKIHS